MKMKRYTAIIVDDEAINIVLLKRILSRYCANIEMIGESLSFENAVIEIDAKNPDIIFLDINLKEKTVYKMIDKLNSPNAQIIFITSEVQFALNAFQYNTDFLLKPLNIAEVIIAVNKAIKKVATQKFFFSQELSDTNEDTQIKDYMAVSSLDKVDFLKINDIMFFTADGKYTSIHLSNGKKYFSSKNLGHYEKTMNKKTFFRIHHSYIINMNYVVKINKKDGNYCELSNGLSIAIAKRRQEDFNRFIKIKE